MIKKLDLWLFFVNNASYFIKVSEGQCKTYRFDFIYRDLSFCDMINFLNESIVNLWSMQVKN